MILTIGLFASIILATVIIIADFRLNEDEFQGVTDFNNFKKAMERK